MARYEISYMRKGRLVTLKAWSREEAVEVTQSALLTQDDGTAIMVQRYVDPETVTAEICKEAIEQLAKAERLMRLCDAAT